MDWRACWAVRAVVAPPPGAEVLVVVGNVVQGQPSRGAAALDRTTYFDARRSTFASADLPKVYHVNVVVRISRTDAAGPCPAGLELWRITLRKDGIVRVEALGSAPGS